MSKTTITENDIRLTAYAVGEMDAEEKQQFERLLADSPEAQAEVQAIRALSENLSSEFERELVAVEGQQPLASVSGVSDPRHESKGGRQPARKEKAAGNVLRPRFWAFGSVAAGLAAMMMIVAYVNQDSLKFGSSDAVERAEEAASEVVTSANAVIEESEADVAELREDLADKPVGSLALADADSFEATDASRSSMPKSDVSGPAQTDGQAAGSLALAPARESAGNEKMDRKPGNSQPNISSERRRIALPKADVSVEVPAELSKMKSESSGADGAVAVGGGAADGEGDNRALAAFARGKISATGGSGSGGSNQVTEPGAPAAASTAPMPAKPTTASGATLGSASGNGSAPAPSATLAPSQALHYKKRSEASTAAGPESGPVGGNPVTAGMRSGGFAVDEAVIDGLIESARDAEGDAVDFAVESKKRGGYFGRSVQRSGDRHAPLIDNRFKDPLDEMLSTFSIDVDTASYAQLRRSLLQDGQWPHPNEVRIEELINYFDYDYPAPDWDEVKAGDAAPFAVSLESAPAPWAPKHRLVSVGLKSAELGENRPAANLVFLLDVSGSMNNANKLPLMQKALRALVPQLRADDRVTMVAYAGRAGEVLPPTPGDDQDTILAAIDALSAGGSTNGAGGIALAYQRAREHFVDGGVNRVILGTDGDFNVGVSNDDALVTLVEKQAQSDIFLTVLGFGSGNLNDSMMEKITNKGNGNYFYIDREDEGKKVLVEQMAGTLVTVAKDVKIQVEFNPGKVASYRLIGYANRMLKREDFDNDKVDAGEIGAGHTVTALYEVVPVGVAMELTGQDVEGLKYQKRLAAAAEQDLEAKRQAELADRGIEMVESHELLTVKLRYKQPTADESALLEFPLVDEDLIPGGKPALKLMSTDFQFASAVAAFGMRLRHSEYISRDFSLAAIAELAADVAEVDDASETKRRKEFVKMVEKAAGNEPGVGDDVKRAVRERLEQLR